MSCNSSLTESRQKVASSQAAVCFFCCFFFCSSTNARNVFPLVLLVYVSPERSVHSLPSLAGSDSFASSLLNICERIYSRSLMDGVLDLLKRSSILLLISYLL